MAKLDKTVAIIVSDVKCPIHPDLPEVNPENGKLFIRGFKICDGDGYWWSQCLVCTGNWQKDSEGHWTYDNNRGNMKEGWF